MNTVNRQLRKAAFTLVELLVVVLILGILTAIALPSYLSSVQTSKLATGTTNARAVASAIQADYVRNAGSGYSTYTGANIPTETNVTADLGGAIPNNPCSATSGIGGYAVVANATSWTITPNVDLCGNAGTPMTIKLGN